MSVVFHGEMLKTMLKAKQKTLLVKTGLMGENISALQLGKDGRVHVDTGASSNAKNYNFVSDDTIRINAPMEYDVYLERRYGIMALALDELIPYMAKFEEEIFG